MTLLVTDPKVRLHERHLSMLASHDVRAVWVDGNDPAPPRMTP